MQVSKEEILHIAKLADIKLKEEEIEKSITNLEDILNLANIVNKAGADNLEVTVGASDRYNVFRKDEIKEFIDKEALLKNAPEKERNMFKIPKVINW